MASCARNLHGSRGFAMDDFCLGHISCFHCFTQTHAAADTIIVQRKEAIRLDNVYFCGSKT